MAKAFDCALRLLARREHGRHELKRKLVAKGYSAEESAFAVSECLRLGLQCDARFAESLCNARIRQGYGPLRISRELQDKHIDRDLISRLFVQYDGLWEEQLLLVWRKKFSDETAATPMILQKQQRFLLYRGFSMDSISRLFKAHRISRF